MDRYLSLLPSRASLVAALPLVLARKRLDISPADLLYGISAAATTSERERPAVEAQIARFFKDDVLAGLCVRTLYDALLTCLGLPRHSVVCFSGINIQDMVTITEAHGLKMAALDVDEATLMPLPGELERLLQGGNKPRLLLLAHLFGARNSCTALIKQCHQHGILFVEDLAEAWAGPEAYLGDNEADCCLFSFGTIKTSTALGGGVARVRDPVLREVMRAHLGRLAVRPASVDAARFSWYLPLNEATRPLPFGALVTLFQRFGVDHDDFIRRQSRGFDRSADLFAQMRLRPSVALLKLLVRRLANFDKARADMRRSAGSLLRQKIDDVLGEEDVLVPGAKVLAHEYWLFPVVIVNPQVSLLDVARKMLDSGFDVTSGTTQLASLDALVMDPADLVHPARAKAMMNRIVYLPVPDEPDDQDRLVRALGVSVGALEEGEEDEDDDESSDDSSDEDEDFPAHAKL